MDKGDLPVIYKPACAFRLSLLGVVIPLLLILFPTPFIPNPLSSPPVRQHEAAPSKALIETVQEVDLDGDGAPERIIRSQRGDGKYGKKTLQVEIVRPDGRVIYSTQLYAPVVEAVDVKDVIKAGTPQVIIQTKGG